MRERILLLIAAFVWGCAFVAQRVSTDIIGPFAFNGLRFWLGALSILPAAYFLSRKTMSLPKRSAAPVSLFTATCILGFLLFTGAALHLHDCRKIRVHYGLIYCSRTDNQPYFRQRAAPFPYHRLHHCRYGRLFPLLHGLV